MQLVQENAVMQTCVGATAGLAFTGGFGSYLIAMDQQSYLNLGSTKGNYAYVSALHLSSSLISLHLPAAVLESCRTADNL